MTAVEGARDGFFFTSASARLYAFLHAPPGPARPLGCVVVHPFMEERQDSHGVLRDLAVRLAGQGFPALRFDLYGCGDSEGEWEEATVARWRGDVVAAAGALRAEAGVEEVALVGLRFGATLAALSAEAAGARRVAMVQPVVRGDAYVMELLLAHLSAEMVLHRRVGTTREALAAELEAGRSVNLFGYHLTGAQYRELRSVDLTRAATEGAYSALLVEVARTKTARENADLKALAAALGSRATVVRAVEPQPLHTEGKVQVTRADEVCRAILAWLES